MGLFKLATSILTLPVKVATVPIRVVENIVGSEHTTSKEIRKVLKKVEDLGQDVDDLLDED